MASIEASRPTNIKGEKKTNEAYDEKFVAYEYIYV